MVNEISSIYAVFIKKLKIIDYWSFCDILQCIGKDE